MTENTLRYVRIDYQSHKDALLQRVRARFPRVWNDFLANSFGIVLVDIIAWSMATMAFLINRAAGENYVSTMTLRESAVNIGSLIGYQLRNPTAATVMCEASISAAVTSTVTIAQGTVVRTAAVSALPFQVAQDYFINPGYTTPVTLVVTISPTATGAQVLSTYALVTPGSSNVDLLDTTIDLTLYVQAGQVFQVTGDPNTYVIQEIQAAPGAVANNRLVLASPYVGDSAATVTAQVYDQRIECVQGLTVNDSFVSPGASSPSYVVSLSTTPVIQDSVSVTVNGDAWESVPNFAKSTSDDEVFVFTVTASGQPLVMFGDGTFGALIPTEATITVSYLVGGGSAGNVPLNSISTSITGLIASSNNPITIQITNQTSTGTGGQDAETLEQARINIPAAARTNDRAVTLSDYQTVAMGYSGVAYALAVVRTENSFLEGNIVFIYPWTTGASGGLVNLSPAQQLALQDYMQTKAVGTDLVQIGNGTATPLPISLRFMVSEGFNVNDTLIAVQEAVNSYVNLLLPGQPILYSNLVRTLDDVYGVETINMATPTADLYPDNSLELFTQPQSGYSYSLTKTGVGTPTYSYVDQATVSNYTAQLPFYPIQAWSVLLFLGVNQLTVQPGILPGTAQVFGSNLSTDYANFPSTINLVTGQVSLWIIGAPGDLSAQLAPLVGYASQKIVNIYVGYSGIVSEAERNLIRQAVRAYGTGLAVGAPMYASAIPGIIGSNSNLTAVIAAVPGVTSVNNVALDTPGNTVNLINSVDTQLLVVGNIILNNEID
jgi:hypothetical protein